MTIREWCLLLARLAFRDIRRRYLGSALGLTWAFVHPVVTILVIWFVFDFGFKVSFLDDGIPFTWWLISAIVPWFFFAETVSTTSVSIIEQSDIVKKLYFRVDMLPLVKVLSSSIIHILFVLILLVLLVLLGNKPTYSWFYTGYYYISAVAFLTSLALLTSSIVVFFRDLVHFITIATQIGFWATPIFWSISLVPETYHWLLKLNPAFYITEGYRQALCYDTFLARDLSWTLYFWSVTLALGSLGKFCFARLRHHFAEVL